MVHSPRRRSRLHWILYRRTFLVPEPFIVFNTLVLRARAGEGNDTNHVCTYESDNRTAANCLNQRPFLGPPGAVGCFPLPTETPMKDCSTMGRLRPLLRELQ